MLMVVTSERVLQLEMSTSANLFLGKSATGHRHPQRKSSNFYTSTSALKCKSENANDISTTEFLPLGSLGDLVRDPWRLSNACLKTAKRSGRLRNRVKIVGQKGTLYSTMAPPKGHAMALQGLVKLERGTRGHATKQAPSPIDVAIFNANHCESGMAHRRYTEGKRS